MAKKKKRNRKKKKGITIKNPFQQIAMKMSGAGKHKDKRLKRKRKDDWKKDDLG